MAGEEAGAIIPIVIILVGLAIFLLVRGVKIVKEREAMVIERFGNFRTVLTAGVHFIIPLVDAPKPYSYRFWAGTDTGGIKKEEGNNLERINTMDCVIDFPKQNVITRDNASIYLDAVLSFKVVNPKGFIYSCTNLQNILSKLLQAQLRNVAGGLDVDQLVEDASAVNVLTGLMDAEASRWGVKIKFVKVQKIETPGLEEVLAKKKRADLQNKEVVIAAKAHKQTMVIDSEGKRDSMIKETEGEAQEMLSRAEGQAQAIINTATAEARSVKEIARAIAKYGDNPAKYMLALKYIEALKRIAAEKGTSVEYLPQRSANVLTAKTLGYNSIFQTP
eukprot:CAMPEP_0114543242 /NCGR_PEP_ID=MMETSP0114-20121206/2253_1 /TAXON_ID=31324 /ORGANISM="Goniomonas sp, Strain m" /LENGTH=332 /DNA_ID=CAMNT_0001727571 /DNA_START=15 /DNA_END=1013 /DNA_ORIENTATION=+